MVASLLQLREPIASEDACDALAIAICHATHVPMLILEARA
jgi:Holliday junction resolvasome RuvABC endonuclease subunit